MNSRSSSSMTLDLLTNTLYDWMYFNGCQLIDALSTVHFVHRYGIDSEDNVEVRNEMRKDGVGKALFKSNIAAGIGSAMAIAALYGIDSLIGIEHNAINIHHVVSYGLGSLKLLQGFANIASTHNQYMLANILEYPYTVYYQLSGLKRRNERLQG